MTDLTDLITRIEALEMKLKSQEDLNDVLSSTILILCKESKICIGIGLYETIYRVNSHENKRCSNNYLMCKCVDLLTEFK